MTLHRFLFPALGFLVAGIAHSAPKDDAASATVRCRVFALNKAPAGDVYVKIGGKYSTVVISTDYVGGSFRTDAKDGIVFYKKIVPAAKAGTEKAKEHYEPLASCAPDGTAPRQLVFLAPDGKGGWQAMAKSDAESAFPLGTRLLFNLSPTPVAVDFGGTRLVVNPKKSALLAPAKDAPDGLARVRMSRREAAGAWVPFLSSVWRQTPEERNLLLVYPVAGTENVSFTCIPDRIEAPDDVEKKAAGKGK